MILKRFAVLGAVALGVACGSSSTGTAQDGGAEGGGDPCAGLGCATGLPSLTLQVHDASGAVIRNPTFSEGKMTLTFQCVLFDANDAGAGDAGDAGDAGNGMVCAKWQMFFPIGPHAVTIGAPGFASQTIMLQLKGPPGCCGQGDQVEQTITLAP